MRIIPWLGIQLLLFWLLFHEIIVHTKTHCAANMFLVVNDTVYQTYRYTWRCQQQLQCQPSTNIT